VDGASIFRSTGRNVQLSPGTQLVLIPNLNAGTNATGDAESANPSTATRNPAPAITPNIADEMELCVAPDCTLALADGQLDQWMHGAQITLPQIGS
jgi:hypothetical protein